MPEVSGLLAAGVSRDAKAFETIGYRQALALVEGRMSLPEALEEMQRDTRRYAKRQLTWWRRERDVRWVSGFGNDETVVRSILDTVRDYVAARGEIRK